MPLGNAVVLAVLTIAPAFVCIVTGSILSFREARRSGERSRLGIRFSIVGASLMFLVPGVAILVGVIAGFFLWPALIAGIPSIGVGLVFLGMLRAN